MHAQAVQRTAAGLSLPTTQAPCYNKAPTAYQGRLQPSSMHAVEQGLSTARHRGSKAGV